LIFLTEGFLRGALEALVQKISGRLVA